VLSFAAPAFLWGLAALPLVILLHRVRVRRERREVAGSFLWRRARDVGARRPRMRASLLLLLQLLAIAGMTLAAARPQWISAGPPLTVLVVDAAASMAARDGASAPAAAELDGVPARASRLEVARRVAERLLGDAGPVAIVRGGREPRLALPATADHDEVRAALDGLSAFDAGRDPARALRLARDVAGAAGAAGARIHWLSDVPPPADAGVRTHPLAGEGVNVGVTGFELVADQAWLRVSSSHPVPLELPVEVWRGEERVAAATLLVPARGDAATSFPVAAAGSALAARLRPPRGDALALDDEAWAGAPRTVVALDRGFAALERALGAIDGVQVRVTSGAAALPADLRVLHGRLEREAPAGPTLLLPARDAPAVAAEVAGWDGGDPLLRFVDLRALRVAYVTPPPFGDAPGWTTLARGVVVPAETTPQDGTDGEAAAAEDAAAPGAAAPGAGAAGDAPGAARPDGPGEPDAAAEADRPEAADAGVSVPLLQRRDRPEGPVWRMAFHPVRGDLTLRPAFPTLVVNLIDRVRGEDRIALGATLPPDASRDGRPASVASVPGPYRAGGRTLYASLLDEDATRLPAPAAFAGRDAAAADDARAVEEAAAGISRRDLVDLLAALAAVLLLLEWWGWSGAPLPGLRALRARRRGPAAP
jgi:hypothetical protein